MYAPSPGAALTAMPTRSACMASRLVVSVSMHAIGAAISRATSSSSAASSTMVR
jgi:hypothetical protein